jgi:molybdenum cofactor cytidylyltransferase
MVRKAARCLLDAGLQPVVAVVSPDARLIEALAGLPLTTVENAHPENGISSSIAIGLRALPETADAALIAVGDQPYMTAQDIEQLVDAFATGRIIVPRFGDHRGNPPVFDRRFFPELLALTGDQGGQRVITSHADSVTEVPLSETVGDDIDRPEQWPP